MKGPGFLKGLRKAPAAETAAPAGEPIDLLAGVPTVPVEGDDAGAADGSVSVPAAGAVTVEALDTTTPEQRREAVADAPSSGDGRIGSTVASLGAPGEPGFWIKTPLVSEEQTGRLVYVGSGRSVQVKLLPSGGPTGGAVRCHWRRCACWMRHWRAWRNWWSIQTDPVSLALLSRVEPSRF